MTQQKELILNELDKFMTWWEKEYNIKLPTDIHCNEIRPLYVAWKEKDKKDEEIQTTV